MGRGSYQKFRRTSVSLKRRRNEYDNMTTLWQHVSVIDRQCFDKIFLSPTSVPRSARDEIEQ
eukprot:3945055-Amphidinium_carterae.1